MHVGLISTSWPSSARPWAGHFIRDLALAIADEEICVSVVTPRWSGHGSMEQDPRLRCLGPTLEGAPDSLANDLLAGVRALVGLRSSARLVDADLWLCHWWPTRFAVTSERPCLVVLHGSDVDLLARLPGFARRWLGRRLKCVAVADGVSERFARLTGQPMPPVYPLGARSSGGDDEPVPGVAREWASSTRRRVLTIARGDSSKGWRTVEGARSLLPNVAWLGLKPEHGVGPQGVRRLIALADLVVVPSEGGAGAPSEGRPHVIVQAMVAGVPVVGGPNPAVREAMALFGQLEVDEAGAESLASAVRRALEPATYDLLKARAREAGLAYEWSVLAPRWSELLREFGTPQGHQTKRETPSY